MVANNEFDVRIPLHADEAFQNGIIFQAKVIHSSIYTQTHTCNYHTSIQLKANVEIQLRLYGTGS